MNDYLVWVDTSTKIASFHEVEASDLLHFEQYENFMNYLASLTAQVWGDRIFEKCGIRREEEGDGGKTLEIRGKRRLSARDGGANYQQS